MIEDFRRRAADYGRDTEGDDITAEYEESTSTNEAIDAVTEIGRRIYRSGDGRLFLSLFDDPNPWVQLCAAWQALKVDEASAAEKLRELAGAGIRLVSMTAELTLEAWNKGELSLFEDD